MTPKTRVCVCKSQKAVLGDGTEGVVCEIGFQGFESLRDSWYLSVSAPDPETLFTVGRKYRITVEEITE